MSVLLSPRIDAKRREWTSIVFIRVASRDGRAFSFLISSLGVSGGSDFLKAGEPAQLFVVGFLGFLVFRGTAKQKINRQGRQGSPRKRRKEFNRESRESARMKKCVIEFHSRQFA
jgi:hypothetical protein